MGWTYKTAKYHMNGRIDRKAECDALINDSRLTVLKSAMVGSTYYAAVKNISTNEVWAAIFLTSTCRDDIFNFGYKDMDETEGPYKCECPVSILKLLTPTDNENADHWRKQCWENSCKRKSNGTMHYGKSYVMRAKNDIMWHDGLKIKRGDEVTAIPYSHKRGWFLDIRGYRTFTRKNYDIVSEVNNEENYL